MQSMTFPDLYYAGRFSPFECPPPPRFEKKTEMEETKTRFVHMWLANCLNNTDYYISYKLFDYFSFLNKWLK